MCTIARHKLGIGIWTLAGGKRHIPERRSSSHSHVDAVSHSCPPNSSCIIAWSCLGEERGIAKEGANGRREVDAKTSKERRSAAPPTCMTNHLHVPSELLIIHTLHDHGASEIQKSVRASFKTTAMDMRSMHPPETNAFLQLASDPKHSDEPKA